MKKIFIILFMFAVVCQADAEVVYIQRYQDTDMEWRDIGNRTAWPWQYNLEIAPGVNVEAQIPTTSYSIMELSILSEGNFGWTAWTGMLLMDNFLDNTNWYSALLGDVYFAQNDLSGADFRNAFNWGNTEFAYNYYWEGNPPLFDPGYTYTDDEIYMVSAGGGNGGNPTPEPSSVAVFVVGIVALALIYRKRTLDKKK
tara:strand:+ start:325 stop:918 length:594 start_codon:yes stop_codon:yes gene_type:complete